MLSMLLEEGGPLHWAGNEGGSVVPVLWVVTLSGPPSGPHIR